MIREDCNLNSNSNRNLKGYDDLFAFPRRLSDMSKREAVDRCPFM